MILARWRSGDKDGFCPVLIASELFHQCLVRHAWAQGSPMPLHYAGASIEATRWWAALMVQPVGLLRAGGRPAMHFEL